MVADRVKYQNIRKNAIPGLKRDKRIDGGKKEATIDP
jgi:hypothetical protein